MKGLISLFLALSLLGVCWGYLDAATRHAVRSVIVKNLLPIVLAILAVAIAIFLSINTTLRLV